MTTATADPKSNGVKKTTTPKSTKPTNEVKKIKVVPKPKLSSKDSIQDKIDRYEKLHGVTTKRERIVNTLQKLKKFTYNKDHSASFTLIDSSDQMFKTSNTELLELVIEKLTDTLETRKIELESQILEFVY